MLLTQWRTTAKLIKNMRAATIGTAITCHGGREVSPEVSPEV